MAIQLLFCGMLLSGFVQNSTHHACVVPAQLFLCFGDVQKVQPYSNMAPAWKNSNLILSERIDFHMVDNLLIAVHVFSMHMLTLLSVDEILLPKYVNCSTNLRGLLSNVEMEPTCLKHMNCFIRVHIETNAFY